MRETIPDEVISTLTKGWNYPNDEYTRAVVDEVKLRHPDAHIYFDLEWVMRAFKAEARNKVLEEALRGLVASLTKGNRGDNRMLRVDNMELQGLLKQADAALREDR